MKPDTTQVDALELNLARRNTVGDALRRAANTFGHRVAVVDGEREITYAQFDAQALAIAHGLLGLDADLPGNPVALFMANGYEILAAYFGVAKSGAVVVPVNFSLTPDDLAWMLNDAGCTTIIVDSALLDHVSAVLAQGTGVNTVIVNDGLDPAGYAEPGKALGNSADPSAAGAVRPKPGHHLAGTASLPDGIHTTTLAALAANEGRGEIRSIIDDEQAVQCLYTSGTTSRPKGALASHRAVVTGVMSNALMLDVRWGPEPSVLGSVLPMFHVTALNTMIMPFLFNGGTVVLIDFTPGDVLDAIEAHGVTVFLGLPMMWQAIVAEFAERPRDVSSLGTAMYAMAQMPERLLDAIDAMAPEARKILGSGQTEVIPATVIQWAPHRKGKSASWGPPSPTVEVGIMGPDGTLLKRGQEGEIVYRGPHVTLGYWNNAQANADAFAHGWFHSGDIGWIDDEGVVWFTDRLKDIIKSGGENVSSMKVERVVGSAPGVLECSIVGTEDEHWGEAVTAVVLTDRLPDAGSVPEAEYAAAARALQDEILGYARERLSGIETPKRVEFLAQLPKTATGKIRKNILRKQL